MSWEIHLTRKAHKFLETDNIQDKEIFDLVMRAILDFDNFSVLIEVIDWRGNAYKLK